MENIRDKHSMSNHAIFEKDRQDFTLFKDLFNLHDYFNYNQPFIYTWANKRAGEERILERLERFYCFPNPSSFNGGHIKIYKILGDWNHSYHLLILLVIELEFVRPSGVKYKMNTF